MINRSLRYGYGRGVARVPVAVPRSGLEMVPLRPSREIVAAISPLYLAALIPASLLLVLSFFVVRMQEAPRATVVIAEFEPVVAPPAVERVIPPPPPAPRAEPEPVAEQPLPASSETIAAAPRLEVKIEIDAIESAATAPVVTRRGPVVAAVKIAPGRSKTAAPALEPMQREHVPMALPDPASVVRQTTALPAVSLAGPTDRPELDEVAGERPTPLRAGLDGVGHVVVARIPEPEAPQFSGLGFEPAARPGASTARPLAGVPLETLAACSTRAREDALKQELMSAVARGRLCRGHGGTYRFLEAKNLNAFSMGVTSDPGRELGNRCEELERAQACVDDQRSGRVQQ